MLPEFQALLREVNALGETIAELSDGSVHDQTRQEQFEHLHEMCTESIAEIKNSLDN